MLGSENIFAAILVKRSPYSRVEGGNVRQARPEYNYDVRFKNWTTLGVWVFLTTAQLLIAATVDW
jgi:hypothetical protein